MEIPAYKTIRDVYNSFSKEQKDIVHEMIGAAHLYKVVEESDVYNSFTELQKKVVQYMIVSALNTEIENTPRS